MAAGNFHWRGVTSAWNTDSNWVNDSDVPYGGGRYPGSSAGDADTVYFDVPKGATYQDVAGGDYHAAAGDILRLCVEPAWDGVIGSSALPLTVRVKGGAGATGLVSIQGTNAGDIYLRAPSDGATAHDGIDTVHILDCKAGSKVVLTQHDHGGGWVGEFADVICLKGNLYVGDPLAVVGAHVENSLQIGYLTDMLLDSIAVIDENSTIPGTIVATGGTVTCNKAIATELKLSGGIWAQYGDIATLEMDGGIFRWYEGDITYALVRAGTLDGSIGMKTRKIANSGYLIVSPGAIANLDNGTPGSIYLGTSAYAQTYGDGIVRWPSGTKVALV